MITELNGARFNAAIRTGRRFYVISSLLNSYSTVFGRETESLTQMNFTSSKYQLRFSASRSEYFNSMHIYNDDDDYDEEDSDQCCSESEYEYDQNETDCNGNPLTRTSELFRCFDDTIFLNRYLNLNYYEFKKRYYRKYSSEVLDVIYAATAAIVPMELNNNNGFDIICRYGDTPRMEKKVLPLIDALYRSDEVMNFINGLISTIMMSTPLYCNMVVWSDAMYQNEKVRNVYDHYKTWNPKIFNLLKCFSLVK